MLNEIGSIPRSEVSEMKLKYLGRGSPVKKREWAILAKMFIP